jgi:hypothetical protein
MVKGHRIYKNSDHSTCPKCENKREPKDSFLIARNLCKASTIEYKEEEIKLAFQTSS